MNIYGSVESLENLIIDLRVIGKIGPGIKMNTKGVNLDLDDTTWYQSAIRWYRGDSRNISANKIKSLLKYASEIVEGVLEAHKSNSNINLRIYGELTPIEFLEMFIKVLRQSKIGMDNLKDTYHNDNRFCSEIESYISWINKIIKDIEKNIPSDEN